jgi:hypothetical protein
VAAGDEAACGDGRRRGPCCGGQLRCLVATHAVHGGAAQVAGTRRLALRHCYHGRLHPMPPSPCSRACWCHTRGGRQARQPRGGGAPRSPVDHAALGRLPRAPELTSGILKEEGERGDPEEEDLLGRLSTVSPRLRDLPCLAPQLHWRKGGRARRGDTRERRSAMREEAHSENGCRRCVLHFCVAWEARLKMGNEDRYSVGDVSVSYSAVLVARFAFLAIRWR